MKTRFVLITADTDDIWAQELASILQPLGKLKIVPQQNFSTDKLSPSCQLVIIDATAVTQVNTLISEVRQSDPERRVIVMTASPSWRRARASFDAGAQDYLSKNIRSDEVLSNIKAVLERPEPSLRREVGGTR
jgi:DNA-binding response OmpR family regulator